MSEKLITGFITRITPSSFSLGIIFAKAVEKAMPSSMKFRDAPVSTFSFKYIANKAVAKRSASMEAIVAALERVCRITKPAITPATAPIKTGANTIASVAIKLVPATDSVEETNAMTAKNTTAPTKSSSAAMGISVLVTGPAALASLTMDRDGAGAVASAMPPNIAARYSGVPVK